MMVSGDLVKPLMTCAGPPGGLRCEMAVVLEPFIWSGDYRGQSKILCSCGTAPVPQAHLEVVQGQGESNTADH